MAQNPPHKPPEWELFRTEDPDIVHQREIVERSKINATRQKTSGLWWEEQRYVTQVVPAEMVNPDKFDHFNYRYQLYARQPVQVEPRSLAEVTDERPPIKYNVKRIAMDKPCAPDPWECQAHWAKHQWVLENSPERHETCQPCQCQQTCQQARADQTCNNPLSAAPAPGQLNNAGPSQTVPACNVRSSSSSVSTKSCCSSCCSQKDCSANNANTDGTPRFKPAVDTGGRCNDEIKLLNMNASNDSSETLKPCVEEENNSIVENEYLKTQPPVYLQDNFLQVHTSKTSTLTLCLIFPTDRDISEFRDIEFPCTRFSEITVDHKANERDNMLTRAHVSEHVIRCQNNNASTSAANGATNTANVAASTANGAADTANAATNAGSSNQKGPREYILRGYPIQDCNDRISEGTRLLCKPAAGSLDIPRDRVLVGKRLRLRAEYEPYDEDKDGPLLCRPISVCPSSDHCAKKEHNYFICEPVPKNPKPEPGYGTYKIIGSKQFSERPPPSISQTIDAKLPQHLAEYKEFTRRCPNFKVGRYDHYDPANELILPSNKSTNLMQSSLSPFKFLKNPNTGKLPPLFKEGENVNTGMVWRLPEFILNEKFKKPEDPCKPSDIPAHPPKNAR